MAVSVADSVLARNESASDLLEAIRQELVNIRAIFGGKVLFGSETYDAGSIADGDEEVGELTITGAALGDFCLVSHSLDVADLAITAAVTAADTVTYQLNNNTGGAIDLASGTVRCMVIGAPAVASGLTVLPAIKVSA